jgi:hypothetical protein
MASSNLEIYFALLFLYSTAQCKVLTTFFGTPDSKTVFLVADIKKLQFSFIIAMAANRNRHVW